MDEESIILKFDGLVQSNVVLYDDKQEVIVEIDGNLKFHFIVTSALAKKPTLQSPVSQTGHKQLKQLSRDGSDINTVGFEIGDVGSNHFLAANKFCYARPHLMLLASNGHRRQYEPLDIYDLEAAVRTLDAIGKDYAIFYNCGQDGGCSRMHKHMQVMPMPENSFAAFLDDPEREEPDVPFAWFYHRFSNQSITPSSALEIYNELLAHAERIGGGHAQRADTAPPGAACPHNMVLTKRWMVVLPRRRARIGNEAGINAMGMLGYIAVATRIEIGNWMRLGLRETLGQLGVPKDL